MDKLKIQNFALYKFMFHISQLYLYTIASNILIASAFFIIGRNINWYLLPLSFCIAVIVFILYYEDDVSLLTIYEIMIAVMLFIILSYFCGRIYDISYDGNSYHKLAVGLLKNHWNPLYSYPKGGVSLDIIGTDNLYSQTWVEAYCKATWIFGASVYALTGNIECGKVYTLIGMVCAFGVTYYYLKCNKKSVAFCILFSLAAMINPIAMQQLDSYYVDGFLHVMIYILVLSLVMNIKQTVQQRTSASLIACSMIICGNIKFTGLLYGGIFCIAYYLWYCGTLIKTREPEWLRKIIWRGSGFALLAAVTVFWAGNTSYVTNFIHHGTFTYPLTGENAIDIITSQSPFAEENHFKNLFLSLFSKMANYHYSTNGLKYELKVPFTVYWEDEKNMLNIVDARVSGFGVLFSGIVLIGLIALIVKFIYIRKDEKFYFLLMNVTVNCFLCYLIKESWWARYAPYIYLLALTGFYIILDSQKKIVRRFAGSFVAAVFIINSALFLIQIPESVKYSNTVRSEIRSLKQYDVIYLDDTNRVGSHAGICFNLMDLGVNYIVDRSITESRSVHSMKLRDVKWLPGTAFRDEY